MHPAMTHTVMAFAMLFTTQTGKSPTETIKARDAEVLLFDLAA